jgi:hypothetical protein
MKTQRARKKMDKAVIAKAYGVCMNLTTVSAIASAALRDASNGGFRTVVQHTTLVDARHALL